MPYLSSLDNRIPMIAQQIHEIRMAAYEQEAKLLGVERFPPLEKKVDDILKSEEEFIGAFEHDTLAGVLSISAGEEGGGMSINSLVVHPTFQRLGLGKALMNEATKRYSTAEVTVQTTVANTPALELYALFGFKEYRRWFVGSEPLELVKLVRSSRQAPGAA